MKKESQHLLLVFVAMLFATCLVSCTEVATEVCLMSFERFVEKVEADGDEFSNADWDQADEKMDQFSDRYDKLSNKFTTDEKKRIIELTARYTVKKSEVKGSEALDLLNDFFSKGAETLENLFDGLEDSVDYLIDEIDDNVDEWDEMMEEMEK